MNALQRRRLGVLGVGHLSADLCQVAVPALLPFLAAQRGYSYAGLGALVLAAGVGSSLLQPLLGMLSDRSRQAWMMPVGIVLGGIGIALVGLAPSYAATAAAILVSGFGVAAFHPEAARFANLASGTRRGRGMSWFALGGNAGFALGPILTTPLVLAFGLPGTLGLAVLPLLAASLIVADLPCMRALAASADAIRQPSGPPDRWAPFARLGGVVALRSGVYFGLQAFVPAYFIVSLGATSAAGNAALTAMLVAGAVGTLAGGVLVDRLGARTVVIGSMALQVPLLVAFTLADGLAATVLLAAIGFVTIASFSVTVVLGQEYLPSRLGLASGVTLGLAIGIGGLAAAALGIVADTYGLKTVMWVIAAIPVPGLALALTLPSGSRRPDARAAAQSRAAART